jgi:predicted TIM-barrel fold metal-dependent hydrolase
MLIDAHAHIFPEIRGLTAKGPTLSLDYGLASEGGEPVRVLPPYATETAYTPEMLLTNMDWAGVEKAVLLQGSFYGEWNEYTARAVRQHPDRLAGLAYFDPWKPDGKHRIAKVLDEYGFSGVKLECSAATGFFGIYPHASLDSPDLDWLWERLATRRLILVLDLGAVGSRSYQTGSVRKIAASHPDMRIVIAHLGQIRPEVQADPQAMRLWEDQIDLGLFPNVWFDCAALPAYFPGEDYPFPSAGSTIRKAVERIGPAKVLWGTDQPGLLTVASLPDLVKMVRIHTAFLPPTHQRMIFGDNVQGLFFTQIMSA